MLAVKKQYQGKNVIVALSDKALQEQGLSNTINLDLASQRELEIIYKIDKTYIETVDTKTKGV